MNTVTIIDALMRDHTITDAMLMVLSAYERDHRPDLIMTWLDDVPPAGLDTTPLSSDDIGELYEYMLAADDKDAKKRLGKYYTPGDVAPFLATSLMGQARPGMRIIDPCCGSGSLTLSTLSIADDPWTLVRNRLLICDIDPMAVVITRTLVAAAFAPRGVTVAPDDIPARVGDFLDGAVAISDDDAIIMNPPYGRIPNGYPYDDNRSRDMYALFMGRAMAAGVMVAITPQSFIGGERFADLRSRLSANGSVDVIAYDNVPGHIFTGRKHGVFNSNTSNSVRAAITVTRRGAGGVRITPLIRWRTNERRDLFAMSNRLLSAAPAMKTIGGEAWPKCPGPCSWLLSCGRRDMASLMTEDGDIAIDIPSTLRYRTSAAMVMPLNRSSLIHVTFRDRDSADLAYVIMNSSLAYAWWRVWDGGITLTSSLFRTIPVPDGFDAAAVRDRARWMREHEHEHVAVKMNAGKPNDSIRWDDEDIHLNNMALLPRLADDAMSRLEAFHANSISAWGPLWA